MGQIAGRSIIKSPPPYNQCCWADTCPSRPVRRFTTFCCRWSQHWFQGGGGEITTNLHLSHNLCTRLSEFFLYLVIFSEFFYTVVVRLLGPARNYWCVPNIDFGGEGPCYVIGTFYSKTRVNLYENGTSLNILCEGL